MLAFILMAFSLVTSEKAGANPYKITFFCRFKDGDELAW